MLEEPKLAIGLVGSIETRFPLTRWHLIRPWEVVLEDGQRIGIPEPGYKDLSPGRRVAISFYPNSDVITEVVKLDTVDASQ